MLQFNRIHLHLLMASCLYTTARAEWWDDFSNNLATDLAPLLALFGERVTMQFLSESTSWLDNFIFAMAPLGVVTAVVSAIRVCGGPGLRAFIGRAQEGGGIAEAELCSSTSRDVCELYHNGAIVRIFGQPKILEVVYHSKATDFYFQPGLDNNLQKPRCGIYTFREYVEETNAGKAEWTECKPDRKVLDLERKVSGVELAPQTRFYVSNATTTYSRTTTFRRMKGEDPPKNPEKDIGFAPNPNLSFNIGIKKRHQCVSWIAAAVGFLLQVSVTLFGGLATYYWQWEKDDVRPQNWAFPLMATGTVLLSCGMFGCAYLVERSTKERRFRKNEVEDPSSVYVTQPGNQTIGDQTYDAFAFSDTPSEPLKDYITSWKVHSREEDEIKVWAAIGLTVIGFGLQFTGLRAMHSSVSVVLLGAILIMSTIRSALRTGRLKGEQNLLRQRTDQVVGHELDWLAMKIGQTTSWVLAGTVTFDQFGGQIYEEHHEGTEKKSPHIEILQMMASKRQWQSPRHIICAFTLKEGAGLSVLEASKAISEAEAFWLIDNESRDQDNQPHIHSKLLHYRCRLAEMTSEPTITVKSKVSAEWDEQTVPVRQQVGQLKRAIESSARILFNFADFKPSWRDCKSLAWSLDVVADSDSQQLGIDQVHLFLRQSDLNSSQQTATWEIDEHSLEAALGLWIWSMISDNATEEQEGNLMVSVAAEIPRARIIALADTSEGINAAEKRFKSWTGDLCPPMSETEFSTERNEYTRRRGATDVWNTRPGESAQLVVSPHETFQIRLQHRGRFQNTPLMRFFGWPEQDPYPDRALFMDVQHPIPKMCAQDLFQRFIGAMATILSSIGGQTSLLPTSNDDVRFTNDVYLKLVEAVQESGLGSRQDAHAILIPAFGAKLMVVDIPAACNTAKTYRRKGELEKAEEALKQAWSIGLHAHDFHSPRLSLLILELAEMYRRACSTSLLNTEIPIPKREKLERFGLEGIYSLDDLEDVKVESPLELVSETIKPYKYLAQNWSSEPGRIYSARDVCDSLEARERDQCLLRISRAQDVQNFQDGRGRTILSWASERGWMEIVRASLNIGIDVNLADAEGRTPLVYAARQGHADVLDVLIQNHASSTVVDFEDRTPLTYASERGHIRTMEVLIDQGGVEVNGNDGIERSPLHWAVAGWAKPSVEFLLNKGASIEARDEQGYTPYNLALVGGRNEISQYLLERGANTIANPNNGVLDMEEMENSSPERPDEENPEPDDFPWDDDGSVFSVASADSVELSQAS